MRIHLHTVQICGVCSLRLSLCTSHEPHNFVHINFNGDACIYSFYAFSYFSHCFRSQRHTPPLCLGSLFFSLSWDHYAYAECDDDCDCNSEIGIHEKKNKIKIKRREGRAQAGRMVSRKRQKDEKRKREEEKKYIRTCAYKMNGLFMMAYTRAAQFTKDLTSKLCLVIYARHVCLPAASVTASLLGCALCAPRSLYIFERNCMQAEAPPRQASAHPTTTLTDDCLPEILFHIWNVTYMCDVIRSLTYKHTQRIAYIAWLCS